MKTAIYVFAYLAVAGISLVGGGEDINAEAKKLVGRWIVQSATRDGELVRDLEGAIYSFDGNTMTVTRVDPQRPSRSATYRVLAPSTAGKPMRIAFVPQEGEDKGEEMSGVFRFKSGLLELCHCTVPLSRKGFPPENFAAPRGSGFLLLSFKKAGP